MKLVLRALLLVSIVLGVILGAAYWATGTQSGTSWLVRQAMARAPDGLDVGPVRGTLLRGIEFASLEWRGDTAELRARDVAIDFALLPLIERHLLVDTLTASSIELLVLPREPSPAGDSGTSVQLPVAITLRTASLSDVRYTDGTTSRSVQQIVVAGDMRNSRLRIRRLELRSEWADLDLAGTVELAGALAFDATAAWRWKADATLPLAGRLRAKGTATAIAFEHQLLEPLAFTSRGSATIEPDGVGIDILNEWQQLRWETPQGMFASSHGTLHLSGRTDDIRVDLDVLAALGDLPEAALTASGQVRWRPQPEFNVAYQLLDLDPAYIHTDLRGRLASRGQLAGVLRNGALELDLRARELAGEVNGHSVAGDMAARISPRGIDVTESIVRLGDNTARLQGHVGDLMNFDLTVELDDLGQLLPALAGAASGRLSLRGTPGLPEVNGEVVFSGLGASGAMLDSAAVRIAGSAGEHSLEAHITAYDTNIVAEARGALNANGWSGRMTRLEFDNPLAGQWVSRDESDLQVTTDLSRLAELCLYRTGTSGKMCLGGALAAEGKAAFDLTVAGLPIAALPIELPAGVSVSGLASARFTVARVNEQLRADARFELADTAFDAVYMDERVVLALSEARGQASIVNNRLDSSFRVALADGTGLATATFVVPDIGADQFLVSGNSDIEVSDASLFAIFVPGISKPQGRIDGEVGFSGSAVAPEFTGFMRVSDGAFGVRQTGIAISDLNLELAQHEPGRISLNGSARSGKGVIDVAGYTWVGQDLGIRSEVTLTGVDFELARLPDWQLAASPAITVVFDDRATRITGDLGIPNARVTMREAPQSSVQTSSDTIVHREQAAQPERRRRIEIDVRTVLGDDIQFAGFGLTAGVEGSLFLRGGTHSPYTGQGRLALIDGRYKAFGQELSIERGDLVFNGPIEEPLLDMLAVRNVQDVRTGIRLSGMPSRLRSEIFSDPVLSDAEALAYLLTGRPLADATTTGEGQALDQAVFALGLSGAGLVAAQVRAQLGLETLTIEGLGDESRLVAGKRLGNRLLVEYGYGLVDKLGTLLLRYQLNERLVLESRTGTVSNFDIVYRRRKL